LFGGQRERGNENEGYKVAARFIAQEAVADKLQRSLFPMCTIDLSAEPKHHGGFPARQGTTVFTPMCACRKQLRHFHLIIPKPGARRDIEHVAPAQVRKRLGLKKGALDVLVGGRRARGSQSMRRTGF